MSSACPRPSAPQTQLLGLADAVSRTRHSSARSLLPSCGFHALAIALPTLRAGSHPPTSKALLRGPRVVGVWDATRAGVGGGWCPWAQELSDPVPVSDPGCHPRRAGVGDRAVADGAVQEDAGVPGHTPPPPHTHTPARTASRSRAGLGQSMVVHKAGGDHRACCCSDPRPGPPAAPLHPHCGGLPCPRGARRAGSSATRLPPPASTW